MERGVIDGFAWPLHAGITSMGFAEVTKYCIDHGFWRSSAATVINESKWNSLPKRLQDLVMDVSIETEHFAAEFFTKALHDERKRLIDAGMKFIKFSPSDSNRFMAKIRKAQWEEMRNRIGPEKTAKLMKLFSRDALK
jgi:TRAP-type C4-dicarboxylate transport system substrate-binding protein